MHVYYAQEDEKKHHDTWHTFHTTRQLLRLLVTRDEKKSTILNEKKQYALTYAFHLKPSSD